MPPSKPVVVLSLLMPMEPTQTRPRWKRRMWGWLPTHTESTTLRVYVLQFITVTYPIKPLSTASWFLNGSNISAPADVQMYRTRSENLCDSNDLRGSTTLNKQCEFQSIPSWLLNWCSDCCSNAQKQEWKTHYLHQQQHLLRYCCDSDCDKWQIVHLGPTVTLYKGYLQATGQAGCGG